MEIRTDCRFFRGYIPCEPHKLHNVHCSDCSHYQSITERILIIKLGAAGDVIRTTPILHPIRKRMPSAHITWLTDFPELVPSDVDSIIDYSQKNIAWLTAREFDIVYSLDKDKEAIAIAESVRALSKYGFGMDRFGRCRVYNEAAQAKYETGLFDDISKANIKSYPQEIFEICGFSFSNEEYILNPPKRRQWNVDHQRVTVGLNTGCGGRWTARLWKDEHWISLAGTLIRAGYNVIWLGGEQEDEKNTRLQKHAGGHYPGYFGLRDFIALMDECDIIVTQVTMAMHIAIGLRKHLVLMNNIFNRHEFELYGRGTIVEPEKPCGCYYTPVCPHDSMDQITPDRIMSAIVASQPGPKT